MMMKPVVYFFMIFNFINLVSISQSKLLDFQIAELNVLEPDIQARKNQISQKNVTYENNVTGKILVDNYFFDSLGRIIQWRRNDTSHSIISIDAKYTWVSDTSITSTIRLAFRSLNNKVDADHLAYRYCTYSEYLKKVKGQFLLDIKVDYKIAMDKSLQVVSVVKNDTADSFRYTYASSRFHFDKPQKVFIPGDTTFLKDTILLTNLYSYENVQLVVVKRYYIPNYSDSVKIQIFTYVGDSLSNYWAAEDSVDNKGRIFWHKKYYGVNMQLWESQRTTFNDIDGSRTIERDLNPSDGVFEFFWERDRYDRLVKFKKLLGVKQDKLEIIYSFSNKGLLIRKDAYVNGIRIYNEAYDYKFQQQHQQTGDL
jgi:hypothetical protein